MNEDRIVEDRIGCYVRIMIEWMSYMEYGDSIVVPFPVSDYDVRRMTVLGKQRGFNEDRCSV